jgi:hypothetical protein
MRKKEQAKQSGRRDFLRKMAVAGGSAAVVAATGKAAASTATEQVAASAPTASGYRETDHIRAYYRTARA